MNFAPRTRDDIAEEKKARQIQPGWYAFEVFSAENKVSKKGNDMIALELGVWNGEQQVTMRDWLLEASIEKLLNFCHAVDMEADYESGHLQARDLIGKQAYVKVALEKKGEWAGQAKVADYARQKPKKADDGQQELAPAGAAPKTAAPAPAKPKPRMAAPEDDDIPF